MTKIINLYGGPGTGKSTSAAYIFAKLKSMGKNVELVREYVKAWAWEGRIPCTYDQIYFLGKQVRHESMLYGKVDYIVTDSPVMMGGYYAKKYSSPEFADGIKIMIDTYYNQSQEDGHHHYHIFLNRSKGYNPAGRYQTEEQAREIDVELMDMMADTGVMVCGTEFSSLDSLVESVL